jgi:protein-L-isoaspartate(D-aspartate) O-methyltransferase
MRAAWIGAIAIALCQIACTRPSAPPSAAGPDGGARPGVSADGDRERAERLDLVKRHIEPHIKDERVLRAMRKVPRHLFVPPRYRSRAYEDRPLPIGLDQTISQPYIVAYMTEALKLTGHEKVLEIGTGSGYQAAVLAEVAKEVYSIEIVKELGLRAKELLERLGYDNIHLRIGDGYRGWPDKAPFDAIILTAAPGHVPEPLLEQLAVGGRLIAPVGKRTQNLVLYEKTPSGIRSRRLLPVIFVPMTGEAELRHE